MNFTLLSYHENNFWDSNGRIVEEESVKIVLRGEN